MKKKFEVLKKKPKINIRLTRDSVCAADDYEALHERTISVYSFTDPMVLVTHIASGYLPTINGVGHTWDCVLNETIIATISVNEIQSKVSEVVYDKNNHIHFIYHSATY